MTLCQNKSPGPPAVLSGRGVRTKAGGAGLAAVEPLPTWRNGECSYVLDCTRNRDDQFAISKVVVG
jgi:hypothetical protein